MLNNLKSPISIWVPEWAGFNNERFINNNIVYLNMKGNKMGFLKDQKAQGSMMSFFTFIMGLILLAALLPVANSIVSTIIGGNMSVLANADIIRLLVGMTGVIMVILFLMSVISDFQTRSTYTN